MLLIKTTVTLLFCSIVAGRTYLLERFAWGLGSSGAPYLGSVLRVEFAFLFVVSFIAVFALRRTSWSLWFGIVPISLAILSSPVLMRFDEFWVARGFQVAEAAGLINIARLAMVLSILVIILAGDWKPKTQVS